MSAPQRSLPRRVGLVIVIAVVASLSPASAYPGAPWFFPGGEYEGNFPDPHVFFHDGTYYAYATNTGGPLLPSMTSADLETWVAHEAWATNPWNADPFFNDALVQPPWWADGAGGHEVWAPAVELVGGRWRAYYAVRQAPGRYCVSVASADDPLGPFTDVSSEPLTCGHGPAGAIDPWVYTDRWGQPWLVWKTEPYSKADEPDTGPMPAAIWSQPLTSTGRSFIEESEPSLLLAAGAEWEGGVIENPALVDIDGQLVLFYSGNNWESHEYATGWATCVSVLGPCGRGESEPFLAWDHHRNGPGGASVFTNEWGEWAIAFHAWNSPYVSYPEYPACLADASCEDQGQRFLHVETLCWLVEDRPTVGVPDDRPFCDVRAGEWETGPISWLDAEGITTGVTPSHFAPDRPITRAEAVTFLWRLAGSPLVAADLPFIDVVEGSFYADAVAWAFDTGVIRGTSPITFAPTDRLSRAQMALVLHRAGASPDPAAPPSFDDVAVTASYAPAVAWLAETGITTGTGPTTFSPDDDVSRAQLAAFLCRYAGTTTADAAAVQSVGSACGG